MEGISEDFARITSDNVDPVGRGINHWSTGKQSTKTLQGLPVTSVEPGGRGVNSCSQLGNRICKGFARITFDNVDWG